MFEKLTTHAGAGIYAIQNTDNGKWYIGSSREVNTRLEAHRIALEGNKHTSKDMQTDYNAGNHLAAVLLEPLPVRASKALRWRERIRINIAIQEGITLYNDKVINYPFASREKLIREMAMQYCNEHFGVKLEDITRSTDFTVDRYYQLVTGKHGCDYIDAEYRDVRAVYEMMRRGELIPGDMEHFMPII